MTNRNQYVNRFIETINDQFRQKQTLKINKETSELSKQQVKLQKTNEYLNLLRFALICSFLSN